MIELLFYKMPRKNNRKSIIPPDFRKNQKLAAERYNQEMQNAPDRLSIKGVEKRRNLRDQHQKQKNLEAILVVVAHHSVVIIAQEAKETLESLQPKFREVPPPYTWLLRNSPSQQQS